MAPDPGARTRFLALVLVALVALTLAAPMAVGVAAGRPRLTGEHVAARPVVTRAIHRAHPPRPVIARPTMGPAAAGATIVVTYTGFSAEAQAAFQRAVDLWAAAIDSSQPIHINATWAALGSGILGSAGPSGFYRLSDGYYYATALAEARCSCETSATVELSATFNSAFTGWYLGTDGKTPSNKYEFVSVVLHEIGHGLGFLSTYKVASGAGSWGLGASVRTRFDDNVYSAQTGGGRLNDTTFVANNSAALATELTDGSVWLGGPNLLAANGGERARIYAPSPWQSGSSGSHFDEATFTRGGPGALMTPALSNGEVNQVIDALTLGPLRDMGWPVPAVVPPPSPSPVPSVAPSVKPSVAPSVAPSVQPSVAPSVQPSVAPSVAPSAAPSAKPSVQPSVAPSVAPSADPSTGPEPPSISIGDLRHVEGTGSTRTAFRFTVRLSAAAPGPVSVTYRTVAGTALAVTDYLARTGTLTIPAGQLSATVVIKVIADRTKEPDERFTVRLSAPVGATLGDRIGQGTITTDD